jgi:hypothetical protein
VAPFSTAFPFSLEVFKDKLADALRSIATNVTVISDNPSRLRDGAPAREVEIQMFLNGKLNNSMGLIAKKGDMWINMAIETYSGSRIGEDLKNILYSIVFEPDKDLPVKVPLDVQEFLDQWCSDVVSHDLTQVMNHYSDHFLRMGNKKKERELFWRLWIGKVSSCETGITDFIPSEDKAYLTGFWGGQWGRRHMLDGIAIIKENGKWKWFGDQKNPF